MADIALAILNKLSTVTAVTFLVGDRIYPEYDRQSDRVYPLCVYKIDITPAISFDGPSGIEYATVRIAAVATTYKQAGTVANALHAALEGQRGTWAGTVVQGCFLQDNGVTDDVVTEPTTEAILFYIKSLAFDVAYTT